MKAHVGHVQTSEMKAHVGHVQTSEMKAHVELQKILLNQNLYSTDGHATTNTNISLDSG